MELRFQMYDIDKNSQFTRVITLKIINPNLSTKRTISHQSTQTWIDKVLLLNISLAQYIHILCCLMIRKHPISCETGTKKKKRKKKMGEGKRTMQNDREISVNMLCLAIGRDGFLHSTNIERNKNHSLDFCDRRTCFFNCFLSDWLFWENNVPDRECLMVFGSIHVAEEGT